MKQIIKIVLTGGPCAGKTTIFNKLQQTYVDQAVFIPEVATALLDEGYPREEAGASQEWQQAFQQAIFENQIKREKEAEKNALDTGKTLIICDRGVLDGAAYAPGGRNEFCTLHDLDLQENLHDYTVVIHLESRAIGEPENYSSATNKYRRESVEVATKLDVAVWKAWLGHPKHERFSCNGGIETKLSSVQEIIDNLLQNQKTIN